MWNKYVIFVALKYDASKQTNDFCERRQVIRRRILYEVQESKLSNCSRN